jgi:hypothetical protein
MKIPLSQRDRYYNCGKKVFYPDNYSMIIVQNIIERNDIACSLRQNGMLAIVVEEDFRTYIIKESENITICNNDAWEVYKSPGGADRYIAQTIAERDSVVTNGGGFEGLQVYVEATKILYLLKGSTNLDWIPIGGAGDMPKSVYDPTNINDSPFNRTNHTGTQLASTISDFDEAVLLASPPGTTYTAGANVTISGANVISATDTDTTYDSLTAPILSIGTETTGKLISAKILKDQFQNKIIAGTNLSFTGDTLNANIPVLGNALKVEYGITGNLNGVNKVFTTSEDYTPGTLQIYIQGVQLYRIVDFNETGANEITFVDAPLTGEKITVSYLGLTGNVIVGSSSSTGDLSNYNTKSEIDAKVLNSFNLAKDFATSIETALKDGVVTEGDTLKKLYNLFLGGATQKTVANITDRNAFNVKIGGQVFVTDDGDGKWALYSATTSGVNATYVKLSDPDLLNAVMSNTAIASSYESVAGVNRFTNALLIKLNAVDQNVSAAEKETWNNKVDKSGTKVLSDNNFSNQDKLKLNELETSVNNVATRTINLEASSVIDMTTGEDFIKICSQSQVFSIVNPIIGKIIRLEITGGNLLASFISDYTVNFIAGSSLADYVPGNDNYLYLEIRNSGQIFCFFEL